MEFRTIGGVGRDGLLRHAFIFKPDERVKRYHKVMAAATLSASPVPKAAPCTPNPAPGMGQGQPSCGKLTRWEDEEEIENDIENAHQYTGDTGNAHVAAAT